MIHPRADEVELHLMCWDRWRRGEGVHSQAPRDWSVEASIERESRRDDFRMNVITADAERTNSALLALRDNCRKQHAALLHYHLRSTSTREVARVAKCRKSEVPSILRMAHDNFLEYRRTMRKPVNPAPALAETAAIA